MAGKLDARRHVLIGTFRTRLDRRGNTFFVFKGGLLRHAEVKSAKSVLETSK